MADDTGRNALFQAREHAARARDRTAKALDSELNANGADTRKHLRAALAAHDDLAAAHEALKRAMEAYSEPTHTPPQGPSQTSAGITQGTSGPPRAYDDAAAIRRLRVAVEQRYRGR